MSQNVLLRAWVLSDIVVCFALYSLAYFLRVGWIFSTDFRFEHFALTAIGTLPVWTAAMITTRTYALTRRQTSLRNGAYIVFAGISGAATFTLLNYFGFELLLSRKLLLYIIVFTTAGIWAWHVFFEHIMRSHLSHHPVFRVLIVGITRESVELARLLLEHKNPLKPIAFLDGRGSKETQIHGVPVKGKLNKLEDVLEQDDITHLLQCADLEQSINLLSACRNRSITYMLLPSVLGIVERDERIESLEGLPVTIVSPRTRPWGWFFR